MLSHGRWGMQRPSETPMCPCNWQGAPSGGSAYGASVAGARCTMSSQWYQGPAAPNFFVNDTPVSNSREMRNRAEKQRRDKLNSYIGELATLVPLISGSAKRMDKTSILRLTATHLRIYQTLLNGVIPRNEYNMVDPVALEQLMYEQLEGFLLIATPTGKIVFVSHTVEQILGHSQTDLMGQSIYSITFSDDHDKLRAHLSSEIIDAEWRRYFNLKLAKSGPRTESPTYEDFNVMGMVRRHSGSGRRTEQNRDGAHTSLKISNTHDVLVFFVKLYRPPHLSDLLIEATKDEYITRHLIDGRIINCDHRISFVAGYMIEEVSGLSAFKFMHREDVRWTMIALRQMYDRGESVGWSCYRLLSRTGQFIYLRTFGYLEMDNSGIVESFVCVNTLVTEDEGKRLIKDMKERYSVMINATPYSQLTDGEGSNASVEDPGTIDECVKYLITNHLSTSPKTESSTSPNPSAPFENEDCCYLTEIPADPQAHAIEFKSSKSKRTTSYPEEEEEDDEETASVTRKRQKRRTTTASSSPATGSTIGSPVGASMGAVAGAAMTDVGHNVCRANTGSRMHKKRARPRSRPSPTILLSPEMSM